MNEKNLIRIRRLRPIDDDFFKIYVKPKEVVKEIIEAVLMKDIEIEHFETEGNMKNLSGRSVEFDLYVKTKDNVHINIEVEKSKERADPKRERLHSSSLLSSITYPGQTYDELQETYIVFMTEEKVLEEDLFITNIERKLDNNKLFNDGDHIIYINFQKYDDTPLGMIAHDMLCSNPDDMYNLVLRERARYYKETEEGQKEMCAIWDEVRTEGKTEGRIEGREEERVNAIQKIMKNFNLGIIEAMKVLEIPENEFDNYIKLV